MNQAIGMFKKIEEYEKNNEAKWNWLREGRVEVVEIFIEYIKLRRSSINIIWFSQYVKILKRK